MSIDTSSFTESFKYVVAMRILRDLADMLSIYCTSEANFVELPDAYSSTSSMMPHKKNPVAAEMMRAKYSDLIGDLVTALIDDGQHIDVSVRNLSYAYKGIPEKTKEIVRKSHRIMGEMIKKSEFKDEQIKKKVEEIYASVKL